MSFNATSHSVQTLSNTASHSEQTSFSTASHSVQTPYNIAGHSLQTLFLHSLLFSITGNLTQQPLCTDGHLTLSVLQYKLPLIIASDLVKSVT
jgi:hypothetical protein